MEKIAEKSSDGGFVITGSTESFGQGQDDAWVLKLKGDRTVDWQKSYGSAGDDFGLQALETGDGGYAVLGATDAYGAGSYDTWLLKLDHDGDIAWQKTYGGSEDDFALKLKLAESGGFLLSGYTLSFGAGSHDGWFLKLDGSGNVLWQKSYGGGNYDVGNTPAVETGDGSFLLAGTTSSFGLDRETWVLKLGETGDIPDCGLVGSSDATVGNSTAVVENSSAVVQTTMIEPADSDAAPQDAPTQVSVICRSFAASATCRVP